MKAYQSLTKIRQNLEISSNPKKSQKTLKMGLEIMENFKNQNFSKTPDTSLEIAKHIGHSSRVDLALSL